MRPDTPLTASQRKWSYIIWGIWILLFLIFEFKALSPTTPWRTLSETSWSLEGRWKLLKLLLTGGLEVLKIHITNPYWPEDPPKGQHY